MLFRPVRTLILLAVAFGAGILYERQQQAESCPERAGLLADIICD